MTSFGDLVRADLQANTGGCGWLRGISAFLWHPGFATIFRHRLSQHLAARGWKRLANLTWRINVRESGCHFHPDCMIGPGLSLPHPTAIVIGSGAEIGAAVVIYQGVTLGRSRHEAAYPKIGDASILYPNAVIVGEVTVGPDAIVGAHAFVNFDVPAGGVVAAPCAQIRGGNTGAAHWDGKAKQNAVAGK